MTDEQIVKALRCWTGKTVKDAECAKCSFGEDCSLGEIVDAAETRINELKSENAALRERLEKAVELPVPLGTPILKVWENRVPEDDARMSFVDVWEITTVNFKLEHYPLWGKYYFPKGEEGRKAAEARLAVLKGGKE